MLYYDHSWASLFDCRTLGCLLLITWAWMVKILSKMHVLFPLTPQTSTPNGHSLYWSVDVNLSTPQLVHQ